MAICLGPVFIAGYIRNYARHVGLDPEPLVAAYRASEANKEPDRRWSEGSAEHTPRRRCGLLVRLVSIAVVAGLAYLFIQWWQGRAPMGPDLIAEGSSVPDPLPAGGSGGAGQPQARVLHGCAGLAPSGPVPPAAPKSPITPPPAGALGGPEAVSAQGLWPRRPLWPRHQPTQGASPGTGRGCVRGDARRTRQRLPASGHLAGRWRPGSGAGVPRPLLGGYTRRGQDLQPEGRDGQGRPPRPGWDARPMTSSSAMPPRCPSLSTGPLRHESRGPHQ